MKDLLRKLNYKDYERIAVLNADEAFLSAVRNELSDIVIDPEIDQRCPYEFMIIFVRNMAEVENTAPLALHNLTADGILWFCFPKKKSKKTTIGLSRDKGWKTLNNAGFFGVRIITIDDNWSALRFRNVKFIRTKSDRFSKK
ncbi:MAG: hypothetical protein GXY51_03660 [Bacteroidetes bacterium]|jgi:hypothetical protein|nr:hypothetical protein [Bacteroidota bacterium]